MGVNESAARQYDPSESCQNKSAVWTVNCRQETDSVADIFISLLTTRSACAILISHGWHDAFGCLYIVLVSSEGCWAER